MQIRLHIIRMHACKSLLIVQYKSKGFQQKKTSFRSLTKLTKMSEEPKPAKQLRSKRLENSLRANVFDMVSVWLRPSLLLPCLSHFNRS